MSVVQQRPVTTPQVSARPRIPYGALRRMLREVVLVAVLFFAYKLGRVAASGHVAEAMTNAEGVWRLERVLRLPNEAAFQQAIIDHGWLVTAANSYYAYVHFPITAICLIGLYLFRPAHYVPFRRVLAWLTAAALVVHLLMPLAPPRMLAAAAMIDTGKVFGPGVYGAPEANSLTNQFAAMPSLHVGWAVVVAIALIGAFRGRWRWLFLAHPIITVLVVVVTANHYWLDAIVVLALLTVVLTFQRARPTPAAPIPRQRRPVLR